MVVVQYNSTGFTNTQYRCDYTRAHAGVTSCCNLLAPVRQLSPNSRRARMSFSQVQRVFIVEHYLASRSYLTFRMSLGIHFPILLCQTNRQYLVWWTVSVTAETLHRIVSDMRKRVNSCTAERGRHFQHLMFHCSLFSDFNVIYFMTNRTCVGNSYVTSWSPCISAFDSQQDASGLTLINGT
jgi:hypothetical protein